ncbi:DEAD/DEAH box helicase [Oceanospirillum sanctuarii]|uniref:DEAD/DEAH box helicase n=1 Tax=Oceanospirillum sanctuarii TaxID=1434821 RepID=UPI000A3830A0|nr:DEAD/DEAH box helicase family protein [Oceanospirillum sanctuarii]
MLRRWQKDCLEQAAISYKTQSHFLVLAAPGAGKTKLAAEVAKQLITNDQVDYVVCFSPSRIVASGIEEAFQSVLERPFHGRLGSVGASRTYHSLISANQLINDLRNSRVLVVFDEIHHCAGDGVSESNSWGLHLLTSIQELATYTLSLTGTPWRTDTLPLPFARYADREGNILCDFSYGLAEAIRDGVCRMPKVTAIDIEDITVKRQQDFTTYQDIAAVLESGELGYRNLIKHPEIIEYLLGKGISKLTELRKKSPNAGGLIVASSCEHALQIQELLASVFGKMARVVSYYQQDSSDLIDDFKNGDAEWIISIAMISEGTDIPRLQVCCHLTDVTTELYFRQITGRVIRTSPDQENEAYLYMLAEPRLVKYAERLNEDVPGCYMHEGLEQVSGTAIEVYSEPAGYCGASTHTNADQGISAPELSGLGLYKQENCKSVSFEVKLKSFRERLLASFFDLSSYY